MPDQPNSSEWILAVTSNVHIVNDMAWYQDDYTSFDTVVSGHHDYSLNVRGVGTVLLKVRARIEGSKPINYKPGIDEDKSGDENPEFCQIKLVHVLYAPRAKCNYIGGACLARYPFWPAGDNKSHEVSGWLQDVLSGRPCALFKPFSPLLPNVFRLWIPGTLPVPPVKLQKAPPSILHWQESQIRKWVAELRTLFTIPQTTPLLTANELAIILQQYDDEFDFLRQHSFNIQDPEERREGAVLARELIEKNGWRLSRH